jgi:hypothetical protein
MHGGGIAPVVEEAKILNIDRNIYKRMTWHAMDGMAPKAFLLWRNLRIPIIPTAGQ